MDENAERARLREADERGVPWRKWGPYLSERQWGTVREDYSDDGSAWDYFPFEQARFRAYRWGEDGIAGFSDDHQMLCFALAFWNGNDPFLKERYFGLTGPQGNHGEDVKDYYWYLDATPTHSYLRTLYKYPQQRFPYEALCDENRQRSRSAPEFELIDTGIFNDDAYFDIIVEYAKSDPETVGIRITATNRGKQPATLHVLPTLWFMNTWSWGKSSNKPTLRLDDVSRSVFAQHEIAGTKFLQFSGEAEPLFTENESNAETLWNVTNASPYTKDGIDAYVVRGARDAVNPERVGTKAAVHHVLDLAPGEQRAVHLRLGDEPDPAFSPLQIAALIAARRNEADVFYHDIAPGEANDDLREVQRQALAGMIWSKQTYRYGIVPWLNGDGPFPHKRQNERNANWVHLSASDVISMPDKWEYPWFAAWDLAFHAIPFALCDIEFAKQQLELLMHERFMHPNGQIPAYEWAFEDVNPPVHPAAALAVYMAEKSTTGRADTAFLERMFIKLVMYFTWWVNRKDPLGRNVFSGGFLGLDNIGPFDRSSQLPAGFRLMQSDGTSWMALFCISMMEIARILAQENPVYYDALAKFAAHFVFINDAVNEADGLWDEQDGFYYDVVETPEGQRVPLRLRSMVGLIPLFATSIVNPNESPLFERVVRETAEWIVRERPDLKYVIERMGSTNFSKTFLMAIVRDDRLERVLKYMLDENEFLSPYGIRSLSKVYEQQPFTIRGPHQELTVRYEPAESSTGMFGGNSNWRGPIWFPVNFMIIASLRRYHAFYGDRFTVEMPTGSGRRVPLNVVADELAGRLISIFTLDANGRRPVFGGAERFQNDPSWRDNILFYEYFHGDNGAGIGASHQTGWTGLVATLIASFGTWRALQAEVAGSLAAAGLT
ncbi:MAG: glucosidase [Candidatus Eremiobacteraeota bacterium]|nr:glucosidase [Candidatus Eremiobacteraeota bacterium]